MIGTRANFGYMLVGLVLLWLLVPIIALTSTNIARIALDITLGLALVLGAWSLNKETEVGDHGGRRAQCQRRNTRQASRDVFVYRQTGG